MTPDTMFAADDWRSHSPDFRGERFRRQSGRGGSPPGAWPGPRDPAGPARGSLGYRQPGRGRGHRRGPTRLPARWADALLRTSGYLTPTGTRSTGSCPTRSESPAPPRKACDTPTRASQRSARWISPQGCRRRLEGKSQSVSPEYLRNKSMRSARAVGSRVSSRRGRSGDGLSNLLQVRGAVRTAGQMTLEAPARPPGEPILEVLRDQLDGLLANQITRKETHVTALPRPASIVARMVARARCSKTRWLASVIDNTSHASLLVSPSTSRSVTTCRCRPGSFSIAAHAEERAPRP